MAAGEVRVKLQFDYPPPAVPESRQLWLLLSTEQCRAVTDLSCLIRERFYAQQRGALSLYLQDCLLPPGESARLLRDNDLIRVKWEAHDPSEEADEPDRRHQSLRKSRKRRRCSSEEDSEGQTDITAKRARCVLDPQPVQTPRKRRKKKKSSGDEDPSESSERKERKKKKKQTVAERSLPPSLGAKRGRANSIQDPSVSEQETPSAKKRPKKPETHPRTSQGLSSSRTGKRKESSTSSSEEEPPAASKKLANSRASTSSAKTPGSSSGVGKRKENSTSSSSEEEPPTASKKLANSKASTSAVKTPGNFLSAGKRKEKSSSSSSSSSEEGEEPPAARPKTANSEVPTSSAKTPGSSSAAGKRKESSTSSSSSSEEEPPAASKKSSNDAAPSSAPGKSAGRQKGSASSISKSNSLKDGATQNRPVAMETVRPLNDASKRVAQDNVSSSSDSDTFVIKKSMAPNTVANGNLSHGVQQGPNPRLVGSGRGRGRGGDQPPWRGQRGFGFRGQNRGRGRGQQFFYSYDSESLREKQLHEPTTNVSIVLQNPPEPPKKDYSALPLLAAPPQVGKVIAFKLLELTESYTPEVSEYKEGRILNYDPVTQQLEVELLSRLKRKEPGKFDLVYESEDGKDIIEYAVPQDHKITQHWSSLIEPRLVIENGSEGRPT